MTAWIYPCPDCEDADLEDEGDGLLYCPAGHVHPAAMFDDDEDDRDLIVDLKEMASGF